MTFVTLQFYLEVVLLSLPNWLETTSWRTPFLAGKKVYRISIWERIYTVNNGFIFPA
jgi:hypothetical protein